MHHLSSDGLTTCGRICNKSMISMLRNTTEVAGSILAMRHFSSLQNILLVHLSGVHYIISKHVSLFHNNIKRNVDFKLFLDKDDIFFWVQLRFQ